MDVLSIFSLIFFSLHKIKGLFGTQSKNKRFNNNNNKKRVVFHVFKYLCKVENSEIKF